MDAAVVERDVCTLLINLADIPLREVLALRDSALSDVIARIVQWEEETDRDRFGIARFSNYI